jgi:hypothetical protein
VQAELSELRRKLAESQAETESAHAEHRQLAEELATALEAVSKMHSGICKKETETAELGGIGVKIEAPAEGGEDSVIRIDAVHAQGPAAESGKISVDDTLLEVDGQDLTGLTVEEARELIVGPAGTPVTLKARRQDDGTKYMVTLLRAGTGSSTLTSSAAGGSATSGPSVTPLVSIVGRAPLVTPSSVERASSAFSQSSAAKGLDRTASVASVYSRSRMQEGVERAALLHNRNEDLQNSLATAEEEIERLLKQLEVRTSCLFRGVVLIVCLLWFCLNFVHLV